VKTFLRFHKEERRKKNVVLPEDNGTVDRVLYMGLYMAVIPTRGEGRAEKKRFFGHGGEDGGGDGGSCAGVPGCEVARLQGWEVARLQV